MTPLEVFQRHFASLKAGDMQRVLADYAIDAVAADPDGIGVGHDYIRASYERVLPTFGSLELERAVVSAGDTVFVSWSGHGPDGRPLAGADTFVIRNDLIRTHTFFSMAGA